MLLPDENRSRAISLPGPGALELASRILNQTFRSENLTFMPNDLDHALDCLIGCIDSSACTMPDEIIAIAPDTLDRWIIDSPTLVMLDGLATKVINWCRLQQIVLQEGSFEFVLAPSSDHCDVYFSLALASFAPEIALEATVSRMREERARVRWIRSIALILPGVFSALCADEGVFEVSSVVAGDSVHLRVKSQKDSAIEVLPQCLIERGISSEVIRVREGDRWRLELQIDFFQDGLHSLLLEYYQTEGALGPVGGRDDLSGLRPQADARKTAFEAYGELKEKLKEYAPGARITGQQLRDGRSIVPELLWELGVQAMADGLVVSRIENGQLVVLKPGHYNEADPGD